MIRNIGDTKLVLGARRVPQLTVEERLALKNRIAKEIERKSNIFGL